MLGIQNSIKSEYFTLEQRSVIKFLMAERCKVCEIYRRMCDVNWGACFSQKIITNGLTWVCHFKPESKKRKSIEWKHIGSSEKNKSWVPLSAKKVMLTIFWDMKGPIIIDFFEKGATVNSAFYRQFFRQSLLYLLHDLCIYIWKDWDRLIELFKN